MILRADDQKGFAATWVAARLDLGVGEIVELAHGPHEQLQGQTAQVLAEVRTQPEVASRRARYGVCLVYAVSASGFSAISINIVAIWPSGRM